MLEKRGFEVYLEKVIRIDNGPQKRYEVDVYGVKNGEVIMYECGDCKQEKLEWLRKNVGKTIHMPYLDTWCSFGWSSWRKYLSYEEEQAYLQGHTTPRLSRRKW